MTNFELVYLLTRFPLSNENYNRLNKIISEAGQEHLHHRTLTEKDYDEIFGLLESGV